MDNFNDILNPILKAYNRLMVGLNLKTDKGVGYSETYFSQFSQHDRNKIGVVYQLKKLYEKEGDDNFVQRMRAQGLV